MLHWLDVFPRQRHQRVLVFRPGLVPGTIVLVQHALHRAEVTAHAVPPCMLQERQSTQLYLEVLSTDCCSAR